MKLAMSHISVLLDATVDAVLAQRQTGVFVDATFGRGGHSRALLARLDADARLIAFDKDPQAIAVGTALAEQDARFQIVHSSFAELQPALQQLGISQVDGIMADLGVSSPQLDQAERGFSFMHDGPLDMRMDDSQGQTAAEWLMQIGESDLADVIYQYGEERYSRRIARAIKQHIENKGQITSTLQLAELVKIAHPKWEKHKHPATRTFQAIRIAINAELTDIEQFLPQAVNVLREGGRLAVISFHSLEDRLIKQFIQAESSLQDDGGWGLPIPKADTRRLKKIDRIKASETEVKANPRARSAWLRVAERLG